MQQARAQEDAADPEARRDRVQAFPPVDVDVEERVEEVEAGDPGRDGAPELPGLERQLPRDRDPRAHRREPVDGAQPEMAEPRHALEVRVDDEARNRDRPEPAHDLVQLEDRNEKHDERREAEQPDLRARQQARRQLARRGARVARVELRVDEPVEAHRERSRADHRNGDP